MTNKNAKELSVSQQEDFIKLLQERFEKNAIRHKNLKWPEVESKLNSDLSKLRSLYQMEITGGEPDVIDFDKENNEYTFCDCSTESPAGRRSLCYDKPALDSRKANKPQDSAINVAAQMGIELLNEEQYKALQLLGGFDLKTSSWLQTPSDIRKLGGAIFGDRRFGKVFVYHNGADSYYAARGFRGSLRV